MIRKATHMDVQELVRMGRAMHKESNYSVVDFDDEQCAKFIHWMLDQEDGFIAVAEQDGELVGYMAGHACPQWFGRVDQKAATDYGLYVAPACRRGPAAVQLAMAYRDWALEKGCVQIRAGTAAGAAGQGANAIYEHLGFIRAGFLFVLSPGGQHHAYQTFDHHLAVQ